MHHLIVNIHVPSNCQCSRANRIKGENIFGWYHQESLQGMKKEQKKLNHFPRPFIFLSCLLITCTNIWLEVYFGINFF
jgi:hypothetical protein